MPACWYRCPCFRDLPMRRVSISMTAIRGGRGTRTHALPWGRQESNLRQDRLKAGCKASVCYTPASSPLPSPFQMDVVSSSTFKTLALMLGPSIFRSVSPLPCQPRFITMARATQELTFRQFFLKASPGIGPHLSNGVHLGRRVDVIKLQTLRRPAPSTGPTKLLNNCSPSPVEALQDVRPHVGVVLIPIAWHGLKLPGSATLTTELDPR